MSACDACLARGWLEAALAGHLELVRVRISELLALDDEELIAAVGGDQAGRVRSELERFEPAGARERIRAAGLESVCACDPDYPDQLRALPRAPALHVAGDLERCLSVLRSDPVGLVGARRSSPYGSEVARALGRGLAASGVTVVSGMALGIDSSAHEGALAGGGPTVAVLAGPAERPYPASKRALHRRIAAAGAVVSAMPPGVQARRWMFPARNRIIAALSAMTVVVEAGHRSGALLTAAHARELGRAVGAVPGRVTSPSSAGPNALLASGAAVIRDAQDVLDRLFGPETRSAPRELRPELDRDQATLLEEIAAGHGSAEALARAGMPAEQGLAALAELELAGYIRREAGGRFVVLPEV